MCTCARRAQYVWETEVRSRIQTKRTDPGSCPLCSPGKPGQLRQITRRRREAEKLGQDLRSRVASQLRGKLGFKNEELLKFGVPPRRTRRRPTQEPNGEPPPEEPSEPQVKSA